MDNYKKDAKKIREKVEHGTLQESSDAFGDAIELIMDFNSEYGDILEIITADELDEIAKIEIDKGGAYRVACFLYGIVDDLNNDYYVIDGYGNAKTITYSDITCALDDIINY